MQSCGGSRKRFMYVGLVNYVHKSFLRLGHGARGRKRRKQK
jgi:hypothetical protein